MDENTQKTINGRNYIFVPWPALTAVERMAWVYKTFGSLLSLGGPILKNLEKIDLETADFSDIMGVQGDTLDKLATLSGEVEPAQMRQVTIMLLDGVHFVFPDGESGPADEAYFNKYPPDLFLVLFASAKVQFAPFLPAGVLGLFRKKTQSPSPSA